jgi:serine acetyltransferase
MTEIPRAQEQLFAGGQTARERYSALVVGRPGWGALLHYEFVQLFGQNTPGALGLALRKALFPSLLGACGRNVVFGQNVVLRHPHKVRIGSNVVIDDNCLIDAKGESDRHHDRIRVFVGRNAILSCKNGDIELDDGANIGFNCEIFGEPRDDRARYAAGRSATIGGDHDFADPAAAVIAQGRVRPASDRRGRGLARGEDPTASRSAIGHRRAGAVVREVPEAAIAVGVPARVGQRT